MPLRVIGALLVAACCGCVSGVGETLSATNAMKRERFVEIPAPGEATAVVVFYGPKAWENDSWIYEHDQRIGVIGPGYYTFFEVQPGPHLYTSRISHSATVQVNAVAGTTHFVRYTVSRPRGGPAPALELVSGSIASADLQGLRYVSVKGKKSKSD